VNKKKFAGVTDITLLTPEANYSAIEALCDDAINHGFYAICVNSCHVPLAKQRLKDSEVKVCSVIGFPLGAMTSQAKMYEAQCAIGDGADEVDMVINIGALKSGDLDFVLNDIFVVERITEDVLLKVILETGLLSDTELQQACEIVKKSQADFVKTSTGFNKGGAHPSEIKLMRRFVGPQIYIKASGGIRTADGATKLIVAGADRLGIGHGSALDIINELSN